MPFLRAILLTALLGTTSAQAGSEATQDRDGYWHGILNSRIHVIVHVERDSGGSYSGSIENTDNDSGPVPVARITFDADRMRFVSDQVGGRYQGDWHPARHAWVGTWTMQGQTLPLVLVRGAAPPPHPRFVPHPQDEAILRGPLPYKQENVFFPNPDAGIRLAGTLTLPRGKGPFPAIVLISGTGPNDRNEESAGHKIFLVLADALTRKGLAVLRYDKRGVGGSGGHYGGATTSDFASDAHAAVEWLRTRRDVDSRHIGVLGHSEGGVIAPEVAAMDPSVAFVVLLAAPGIRGDRLFVAQAAGVALASGAPAAYVDRRRDFNRELYAAVVEAPDHARALARARAIVARGLREKIIEPREAEHLPEDVTRPWMTQFLKLDPTIALRKLRVPVLAINGSLDLAVPAALNLPAIRHALRHDKDATVRELPGLNHLFQTARTGAPSEFARIPETLSSLALDTVTGWVARHGVGVHRPSVRTTD